jgi:tetratricopeptide (TPR) repeat protein
LTSKAAIRTALLATVLLARFASPGDGLAQAAGDVAWDAQGHKSPTETHNATEFSGIEHLLKEQLRANSNSYLANHNLGEFYVQRGRLRAAVTYLASAQQLDTRHYDNGYDLCLAYLKLGQLPNARKLLNQMLKPNDVAELHNLLGEVEDRAGNFKLAAAEYQRAAEIEPTEQNIFDWANFLVQHQDLNEALQGSATVFRYGVQKYPGSAQLRVGLGVALFALGQYDDAVEALCAAVDLNPADPRPFVFLGRVGHASPRLTDEVLRRLASFVRLYPRNASANYYYALALWQKQGDQWNKTDIDHVEALLKTAIALNPHLYETHFQLGVLYQEQERYSDAIAEYREAVKLRPDFGKAHYRLARTYRIAGKKALAQKELAISRRLREHAEAAESSSPPRAAKP